MKHAKVTALSVILAAGVGMSSRALAQTGPDIDAIKRHNDQAEERRRKERAAEQEAAAARERAVAATRPSIEHVRQLEAEVATRPTQSDLATARADVDRLTAENAQLKAALQAMTDERNALRQRLDQIRSAAGGK